MAQAILLQAVEQLGERGDVVDVSDGYLRNFLVPRKLAQPATPGVARGGPAADRRPRSAAAHEQAERAEENAALLRKTVLTHLAPGGRRRPAVRLGHRAGDRRRGEGRRAA